MTNKRWLAIGLATALFIVSLIVPATINLFTTDIDEEASEFMSEFFAESTGVTVLEDGDLNSNIVVLDVSGAIMNQEASPFGTVGYNHQKTLADLESIKTDETVDAIILRVNSPGGGVYESAELTDKLKEVKEARDIPIYTVMENMAASGGYYIAADSEKIYAQTETITGSIGVIMQGFNVAEMLDKLGIEDTTIKSGALKDLGSGTRENTPEELEVLQDLVDSMYERFIDTVESGRDLTREEIYTLADGRIYDGAQAVKNGLVDELGYFDDALLDLRETYSLENSQVIHYGAAGIDWLSELFLKVKGDGPGQLLPFPDMNTNDEAPQFMYLYKGL